MRALALNIYGYLTTRCWLRGHYWIIAHVDTDDGLALGWRCMRCCRETVFVKTRHR